MYAPIDIPIVWISMRRLSAHFLSHFRSVGKKIDSISMRFLGVFRINEITNECEFKERNSEAQT